VIEIALKSVTTVLRPIKPLEAAVLFATLIPRIKSGGPALTLGVADRCARLQFGILLATIALQSVFNGIAASGLRRA